MQKRGRVISYFGQTVGIEDEQGKEVFCQLYRNQALPVVGDWVIWEEQGGETGTIVSIAPRKSSLARDDGRGEKKILAANIDLLVIVMAPPPVFSEFLIDRYLTAAALLKLDAILVLNKVDLLSEAALSSISTKLANYENNNCPVLLNSIFLEANLAKLESYLKDKVSVLIGPTGVGKSSIIKKLSHDDLIRTNLVSKKGAGKHTTTATRYYHLAKGGGVIDSPGVREFNLWPVTQQEIMGVFKEFTPYISACKFRDCLHLSEPACAVKTAVSDGKISPDRYSSYQQLIAKAKKE